MNTAAAPELSTEPATLPDLLAEARRLRDLFDRVELHTDGVSPAIVDLARHSASRLVRHLERLAALACDVATHDAIKHNRTAFDSSTTPAGYTDGPRRLELGTCRRCRSTIAFVGED